MSGWILRYQKFEHALSELQKAVLIKDMDFIQRAGLIQIFEFTFVLAWKTMKDYLFEEENIVAQSPRQSIQHAQAIGLITDGYEWIDALAVRNEMAHTNNEEESIAAEEMIKQRYFNMLVEFRNVIKPKI